MVGSFLLEVEIVLSLFAGMIVKGRGWEKWVWAVGEGAVEIGPGEGRKLCVTI